VNGQSRIRLALTALLLGVSGCSAPGSIASGRIVSNNPCVDAILARIADPPTIGAVSVWSADPRSASAPVAWAAAYPFIGSTAEEVIAAKPKLALIGAFGDPKPLERAGIRHLRFGVSGSVNESVMQVREIAAAIGRRQEGERLAGQIAVAARPRAPTGRSAIIWLSGGFVPGKGTLADEMLSRAGFRNASARYGLNQWDILPVETLVLNPPDVIFTPAAHAGDRSAALRQTLISRLRPAPAVIPFPEHLFNCGGPSIVEAMAILESAR
jgi:iron complex transport system substrate-binding protein